MLDINLIKNITIETLERYLLENHWTQEKNFKNTKIKLYKSLYDDEEYSIFIPSKNEYKDTKVRILDAVEIISELYEISFEEAIRNIESYSSLIGTMPNKEIETKKSFKDILSIRIISPLSKEGKIPLEYGSNIIEGVKKLILAAIYGEQHPQPYFLKSDKSSHERLDRYKLSQTAIGSYIFNVEVDNELNQQLSINKEGIIEELSEERRVLRRIQNGINNIKEKDLDVLYENGYKDGLNANMCDALLNFNIKNTEFKIETKVAWAKDIPKPTDIKEKVILNNDDFFKVKNLSEKYKETKSIMCEIKGIIITLNNKRNSNRISTQRHIVIQTILEGKFRKVKVELVESDYSKACEAHKNDSEVVVSGELIKEGKTWTLMKYRNFKVL